MNVALKSIAAAGLLAVAVSNAAAAGTFEDGVLAEDRGAYADAVRIFGEAANQGDAKSQFALAEMYRQGRGAPRDDRKAIAWYSKAAEAGLAGAEYRLGVQYQSGQGAPRSDRAAAAWYSKAAAHGYASAQVRLGALYAEGRGVARDDAMAITWFQKAADQGDGDGRARLAAMTGDAAGSPKERFQAMMDRVFGPGRWRETSGYRSVAQEDALRKQGAGAVPAGRRSAHSTGSPDAPGAYDIVVAGMSPDLAAAKLRRSREHLARVVAEGAHGLQGPHLHVEPRLTRVSAPTVKSAAIDARDRVVAATATSVAGEN